MIEFISKLFTSDFMPHGMCFLWKPEIIWLHALSDGAIALSYYLIPLALLKLVRGRQDLPFHWMFLLFGAFIFGCGTTHLMEVWTLWHGTYRLEGVIKAITGGASLATAGLLFTLIPKALAIPSAAQLRAANEELGREITDRRRAERALLDAHEQLETRVRQRTSELAQANDDLRVEMDRRQRADEERRRTEQALSKLQADLAHIVRVSSMGELAASIAHEVNQPLTAVISNADACLRWLAAQPPNIDKGRESIGLILRDARRASEVIQRIRALLKKSPPQPTPQDVNDLLSEVLAVLHDAVAARHIDVRIELAEDPPAVLGDRVQLQQVIMNLVMNAIEAMSDVAERKRALVVSSRVLGTGEVEVSVRDSGVGLQPLVLEKLFDPFFTTKEDGMGMGLSVSQSIIESYGGRLWAVANDGPGATFRFTLPAMHS
jgi:C4-dicarboxylate-specific signal transduction histidine kinase